MYIPTQVSPCIQWETCACFIVSCSLYVLIKPRLQPVVKTLAAFTAMTLAGQSSAGKAWLPLPALENNTKPLLHDGPSSHRTTLVTRSFVSVMDRRNVSFRKWKGKRRISLVQGRRDIPKASHNEKEKSRQARTKKWTKSHKQQKSFRPPAEAKRKATFKTSSHLPCSSGGGGREGWKGEGGQGKRGIKQEESAVRKSTKGASARTT